MDSNFPDCSYSNPQPHCKLHNSPAALLVLGRLCLYTTTADEIFGLNEPTLVTPGVYQKCPPVKKNARKIDFDNSYILTLDDLMTEFNNTRTTIAEQEDNHNASNGSKTDDNNNSTEPEVNLNGSNDIVTIENSNIAFLIINQNRIAKNYGVTRNEKARRRGVTKRNSKFPVRGVNDKSRHGGVTQGNSKFCVHGVDHSAKKSCTVLESAEGRSCDDLDINNFLHSITATEKDQLDSALQQLTTAHHLAFPPDFHKSITTTQKHLLDSAIRQLIGAQEVNREMACPPDRATGYKKLSVGDVTDDTSANKTAAIPSDINAAPSIIDNRAVMQSAEERSHDDLDINNFLQRISMTQKDLLDSALQQITTEQEVNSEMACPPDFQSEEHCTQDDVLRLAVTTHSNLDASSQMPTPPASPLYEMFEF